MCVRVCVEDPVSQVSITEQTSACCLTASKSPPPPPSIAQEEQRELAKTICVSGAILLSTVSNFLDFFKLEAGKVSTF